MPETNWNKVNQFLIGAFGISWTCAFIMRYSQIEYGSEESIGMLAFFYMPAPAIAAYLIQRIICQSSLAEIGFRIKGSNWIWTLLYTPLLYFGFFISFLFCIYLFGNIFGLAHFGFLDFSNAHFFEFLRKSIDEEQLKNLYSIELLEKMQMPFAPLILFFGLLIAFVAGYTINLPFTLGEELGWRGLLLTETKHWGFWKSNVFIGSIWGLWHGPIIMMGHNYPNYPILGIGVMMALCISLSFVLSYIRYKTKTVLGAAAFHGMMNSSAGVGLLLIASPNELFGSMAGVAGILAALTALLGIYLFDRKFIDQFAEVEPADSV